MRSQLFSSSLSVSLLRTHMHTHLPSLFSESLWFRTLLFHWLNKAINSFQIQLPVWRGAMEHEQRHLKRFPANTLLPRVPKAPCYYFQPFAFGDFSLFWGERALSPHKRRATKTPHKVKVEMFPWYPAQGQLDNNIKLAPLGLNLLWHLRIRVSFCHQCSFTFLLPLTHTHTQENGVDWMDFFRALQWDLAEQKSWHLQGEEERRGGVDGGWGGQSSLKLEGEWSSLAVVAARVSQVWSNGPPWPNLLLVVRWPAPLWGDKARGTLSHSLQPVFVKDSQWLSKKRQVGIHQRGSRVCNRGKKGEIKSQP